MTNDVKLNNAQVAAAPKKRKRRASSLDRKKARGGWIFVLPFVVGCVLVYFPILFESIKLSFCEDGLIPGELIFVGFDNYADALTVDPDFVKTLLEGLGQMAFDIPAILIFALFMAVLLNQKMAGRAFFRAVLFVPVIISTGIMETLEAQDVIAGSVEGGVEDGSGQEENALIGAADLQWLFGNMKVGGELVDLVAGMISNIFNIVNRSGVQMLIFLSGLQSISPAIYESCQIDGASAWETFWKITFPMISPMILVNAVYTIIDAFTRNTNSIMMYINEVEKNFTYRSAAMSWIYFIVVIVIIAAIAGLLSAFTFYQRRND